jgi:hypothetical protein
MGYPVGVAVDWDGNLWVALTNSIKKFSPVGQLLKSFNPHESHSEQYVGIVSSPYNGDIFVSGLNLFMRLYHLFFINIVVYLTFVE